MSLKPSPYLKRSVALGPLLRTEEVTREHSRVALRDKRLTILLAMVALTLIGLSLTSLSKSPVQNHFASAAFLGLMLPGVILLFVAGITRINCIGTLAVLRPLASAPELCEALLSVAKENRTVADNIREATASGRTLRIVDADCAYDAMRKSLELTPDETTIRISRELGKR